MLSEAKSCYYGNGMNEEWNDARLAGRAGN